MLSESCVECKSVLWTLLCLTDYSNSGGYVFVPALWSWLCYTHFTEREWEILSQIGRNAFFGRITWKTPDFQITYYFYRHLFIQNRNFDITVIFLNAWKNNTTHRCIKSEATFISSSDTWSKIQFSSLYKEKFDLIQNILIGKIIKINILE